MPARKGWPAAPCTAGRPWRLSDRGGREGAARAARSLPADDTPPFRRAVVRSRVVARPRRRAGGPRIIDVMIGAVLGVLSLVLLLPTAAGGADTVRAATLPNGLRVLLLEDHRSPIV